MSPPTKSTKTEGPASNRILFDNVLPQIGEFGRYQKRVFLLICFPIICSAMHKLAWVFLGAQVEYRCKLPIETDTDFDWLPHGIFRNMTFPSNDNGCRRLDVDYSINTTQYFDTGIPINRTVDCGGLYVYKRTKYQSSAFIEFDLVCDRKPLRATAQALFELGVLLGSTVFGLLSDWLGRRPIFFVSLVIQVVCGILAGVAPNYTTFVAARMLVGASTAGIFLVGFVIAMETVGPSKRTVVGVICMYFFTAGYLVTGTMAYFIRDWRTLQVALSAPGLLFLSYWWFLPESIRWLLTKGRKEEANSLLRTVVKENGAASLPEHIYQNLAVDNPTKGPSLKLNLLQIIKSYPRLTLRSTIIFVNWFVNSGVYYGLSLNTSSLGGNDYINFLISGAVEVPAYALLLLSLNHLGRKQILMGVMIVGGLFMGVCAAIPEGSYAVIYILSAESFPTVIRNFGMGISSMCARVGGISAVYVLAFGDIWKPLPILIFGGASIIGGCLALFIPETLGKRLPETLGDAEKFGIEGGDVTIFASSENSGKSTPRTDSRGQ